MSAEEAIKKLVDCQKIKTEQLVNTIKSVMKEIVAFNSHFAEFIEEQRKSSKELSNNVTRYNILNNTLPAVYPIVTKEELLEELLVKIQEQTSRIHQSIIDIREKYEKLPRCNHLLEKQADQVDWNPVTNFSISGTTKYKAPTDYLEDIADILYQYDIAITCIQHYFDALNIRDNSSYQHLMNSFIISRELSDFVNDFKINTLMLVN